MVGDGWYIGGGWWLSMVFGVKCLTASSQSIPFGGTYMCQLRYGDRGLTTSRNAKQRP